jgi:hypothetical protein
MRQMLWIEGVLVEERASFTGAHGGTVVKGERLPSPLVEEVIAAKRAHTAWGKRRIAGELAKGHGWPAVPRASQVRVLLKAGLWPQRTRSGRRRRPVERYATEPDQAVNADLCFEAAIQERLEAVPGVSGSAGRSVVSRVQGTGEERTWPGGIGAGGTELRGSGGPVYRLPSGHRREERAG